MSNCDAPKKLREFRPMLLACEAIGWLHMAGKAKDLFLQKHGGASINYEYKEWQENEVPPFPWHDMLEWVKSDFPKVDGKTIVWPQTFVDFLTEHAGRNSGILALLQAGHGIVSGIEKNLSSKTSGYLSQNTIDMWRSSAFGLPVRNLLSDPPHILTGIGWSDLIEEIRRILDALQNLGKSGAKDVGCWWRWREDAIGADSYLRNAFSSTIAETRLPNNDVTLWDQSYVAAALFKSAVAGAILEGSHFPWNEKNLKSNVRWRLLTVGIGIDHYESRAVRIGDWSGSRTMVQSFFEKVRRLVEVDLAVGALLYRDSSVLVFTLPGERIGESLQNSLVGTSSEWIRNEIDQYAIDLDMEIPPYCEIGEPTRSLVPMTREIRTAMDAMTVPVHRAWEVHAAQGDGGHVCPVCLVRTGQRYKNNTSKQNTCKICRDRRHHRRDNWLAGKMGNDTIWITELADANDRVALITMSLDIGNWLSGIRMDSLRAQAISEWKMQNPHLTNCWQRDRTATNVYESLVGEIRNRIISGYNEKDILLNNLQEGYKYEKRKNDNRGDNLLWASFYSKIVGDRADAPKWSNIDDEGRARWLLHQFFRKLASPGRIYRFQRQSEEFFRARLADFRERASASDNCWRTRRLLIEPNNAEQWADMQPYAGRLKDAPLDLLYHDGMKGFITISNLARLLEADQIEDSILDEAIRLKSDESNEVRELTIGAVRHLQDQDNLGDYHPVIPLEISPVRFRVLVPLEAASDCVDRTIAAWDEEFARVWDRLPLRIGVVGFTRKTPFQAVVEAARNVEHQLEKTDEPETWRVLEKDCRNGVAALCLIRPGDEGGNGERTELRTVPFSLPDGREDVFYPYLAAMDDRTRFPLDFQHPDENVRRREVYRHVKDLRVGEGIRVYPARVAAMFMDGASARFDEIVPMGLSDWSRMRRLWKSVDRIAPSRTALKGAWADLAAKRETWIGSDGRWPDGGKEAWLGFARALFRNRLNAAGAELDTLVDAARDGLLAFCLEWNLTVLKQKISEEIE
jgi:CRISPR-associated Csx11 family protein